MSISKESILKLVRQKTEVPGNPGAPLADMYKALRAISFYPESHPLRDEIVATACDALKAQVKEKELVLAISRAGITYGEERLKLEANQMLTSLAGELFVRRIQQLTFLPDLTMDDLRHFLQLLSLDPKKLTSSGGMAQAMTGAGIRTIWANEVDVSVIWEKRQAMEEHSEPVETAGKEETAKAEADAGDDSPAAVVESGDTDSLMELLARMDRETNDGRYQQFARNLAAKAESSKERRVFAPLLLVLLGLLQHNEDPNRSQVQKDYAVFTLGLIAEGVMTDFLLHYLETKSPQEASKIYPVLKKLGTKIAYMIIQQLCLADGLHARKSLAAALLGIGNSAIPPLVAMLKDERWYVVRNMVAILGQIGNRDMVSSLRPALYHADQRVRKETVHALVKTGGSDAESMIISLLEDPDQAIVLHAIMALGLLKSSTAVPVLVEIVSKSDFFSKQIKKKKEAMLSLGRIGDKQATTVLMKILDAESWLPWSKWDELKVLAANALGLLADEQALPLLKKHAAGGGSLGKACSEAVDNIERVAEGIYE